MESSNYSPVSGLVNFGLVKTLLATLLLALSFVFSGFSQGVISIRIDNGTGVDWNSADFIYGDLSLTPYLLTDPRTGQEYILMNSGVNISAVGGGLLFVGDGSSFFAMEFVGEPPGGSWHYTIDAVTWASHVGGDSLFVGDGTDVPWIPVPEPSTNSFFLVTGACLWMSRHWWKSRDSSSTLR